MRKKRIVIIFLTVLVSIALLTAVFFITVNNSFEDSDVEKATYDEKARASTERKIKQEGNVETDNSSTIPNDKNDSAKAKQEKDKSYVKPTQEPTYSKQEIEIDKWKSFSVVIDNETLHFPFSFSDLIAIGYDFGGEYKDKTLDFGGIDNPCIYKDGDADKGYINIYITNDSEITLPYTQCKVIGMSYILSAVEKETKCKIGDLLLNSELKKQDIIRYLGEPTYDHQDN